MRMGLPYYDFDYDVRSAIGFNKSCNVLRDWIHPLQLWSIRGGMRCLQLGQADATQLMSAGSREGYAACNDAPSS